MKIISEKPPRVHRRDFLQRTGLLTAGAACVPALLAAQSEKPVASSSPGRKSGQQQTSTIQIGVFLSTFGKGTLEEKLDRVRACGLDCVQLSMDCAGLTAMPDAVSPELATQVRSAAKARGITYGSLHGTFNMCHPDPEQRRKGLRQLRVLAERCELLGTSKIHICTGTRDARSMWRRHPDNNTPEAWRDMAACIHEATEIARQANVILAFEPEVNNVVDSAQKARRLLDEIGSPHLKVNIDPANIFHTGELPRMSEILDEAFALVGKDIELAHAKDLSHDGDAGHEPAGKGKLDYPRYLSLLRAYHFNGPLLLHGLTEAQVPECVAFLREKLARVDSTTK